MDKPFANQEYIIELYNNGFTNGIYNSTEAFYIAKYFYWVKSFGKQKTKTQLIKYCLEHDRNFNEIIFMDQIRKIISGAMKRKPSENKDITITKAELEKIDTIKNYKDQKILFSVLVSAKRSKFDTTAVKEHRDYLGFHIHQNSIFDICRKIGLKLSFQKTMNYIQKFVESGFLEPKEDSFINILYSNDNSQPLIEILGTENPWDKFVEFNQGEWIYCLNCEKKILRKSAGHKYCEECKKEKTLGKYKKYNRKRKITTV
jgi:hypothetical protein